MLRTLVPDRVVGTRPKFLPVSVDAFMERCRAARYPQAPAPVETPTAQARRFAAAKARALAGGV